MGIDANMHTMIDVHTCRPESVDRCTHWGGWGVCSFVAPILREKEDSNRCYFVVINTLYRENGEKMLMILLLVCRKT